MNPTLLNLVLLFFWTIWLSIVLLTNLFEGLQILNLLPKGWKFVSDNYDLIQKTTSVYSFPTWANRLLFLGVLVWQVLGVVLFWIACIEALIAGSVVLSSATLAFTVSLALWAAFLLSDEFFRHYQGERSHLQIFIAQLATLLVIYLLPH